MPWRLGCIILQNLPFEHETRGRSCAAQGCSQFLPLWLRAGRPGLCSGPDGSLKGRCLTYALSLRTKHAVSAKRSTTATGPSHIKCRSPLALNPASANSSRLARISAPATSTKLKRTDWRLTEPAQMLMRHPQMPCRHAHVARAATDGDRMQ